MDIDKESVSLGADNFVLRGCKLRNTGHIYGIIVFTGPESKIMQNAAKAQFKFSTLEKMMNHSIVIVLITQIIISLLGSSIGTSWEFENNIAPITPGAENEEA